MTIQPATTHAGAELLKTFQARRRSPWAWLLDTSVFFSFDASGLRRHRKAHQLWSARYDHLLHSSSVPEHVLITGANSGLGFALADQLSARGSTVSLWCRNAARGQRAYEQLTQHHQNAVHLFTADLTDLDQVDRATEQINQKINAGDLPPITCLVHNAGLLPLELEMSSTGHELTVAAHLIGPTRLTERLLPSLSRTARIIFVSSGGMYTAPLDPQRMQALPQKSSYDGVYAYALTKRAQVEFAALLHQHLSMALAEYPDRFIDVQSAHPGWADTPGVERSLATFHQKMLSRLRTSDEGAEAIDWLCRLPPLPTHNFWFDWAPRSPYLLGKCPSDQTRAELWSMVCTGAQVSPKWPAARVAEIVS